MQAALDIDADQATEHLQEFLHAMKQLDMPRTEESVLVILTGVLGDSGPSEVIQYFSHRVLGLCGDLGTNEVTLKWLRADGWHYSSSTYKKLERLHELKIDATESFCKKWINRKVRELMGLVGSVSKEHFGCILKMIVHHSGFLIVDHDKLLLSVVQCVVVRDHVGTGTNGMYRPKQGTKAPLPVLKGLLLLSNIKFLVLKKEKRRNCPI